MSNVPSRRYVLFFSLAIIGLAADLLTKAWAFSHPVLREGGILWLWPGHVGVQLSRNWGALFGIGQGMYWLFAALSFVAAVAIPVALFRYQAARDLWLTIALGLVMGGVLGNLYDRLGLSHETWRPPGEARQADHAVRDWVLWQVDDNKRWPNFNIADSLLVVGAAILFVSLIRQPNEVTSAKADGHELKLQRPDGG